MFEWAGGLPALTRMTRLLYEKHVPADSLLAAVYADMPAGQPARGARWLAAVLGGPARAEGALAGADSTLTGQALTQEQRARWVTLAGLAADEAGLPADPAFRSALAGCLEWAARQDRAAADAPLPQWGWGPAGPPDTTSADPPAEQTAAPLPAAGEPVSFARHIRPLFRDRDRQSMTFAFDLWSAADVQAHAPAILEQVRSGAMPCDGTWGADKVAVFQRWTESGMLP